MIHPAALLEAESSDVDRDGDATLLRRLDLHRPSHFDAVIDTDPYNEVDDQFAIAYALLSPERITVEAMYAAPFHNRRATSPADGMRRSFDEIGRVLNHFPGRYHGAVHKGSSAFLIDSGRPIESAAAEDLIERAMAPRAGPLYVIAIAALTNIASALILEPRIAERVVVIWLGGQPSGWHTAHEFNLRQDPVAVRVVLDCGVSLVRIPCERVAQALEVTPDEVESAIGGAGPFGRYLCNSVRDYLREVGEPVKVIWDLSAIAALVDPNWVPSSLVHTPILTSHNTWSIDPARHLGREAFAVNRSRIIADLWSKMAQMA